MGIDWEGMFGDDVDDLQDAYDSLVYDSGQYLNNDYDESDDDKSDVPEPKSDYITPDMAEALGYTLPF